MQVTPIIMFGGYGRPVIALNRDRLSSIGFDGWDIVRNSLPMPLKVHYKTRIEYYEFPPDWNVIANPYQKIAPPPIEEFTDQPTIEKEVASIKRLDLANSLGHAVTILYAYFPEEKLLLYRHFRLDRRW